MASTRLVVGGDAAEADDEVQQSATIAQRLRAVLVLRRGLRWFPTITLKAWTVPTLG